MLSALAAKLESLKEPEVLEVGETLELQKNVPLLLGRSETEVDGYEVRKIEDLEDNSSVSRFGLQVVYDGNQFIFSRPKLIMDGETYRATNKIIITNTCDEKIVVEEEHAAGMGGDTYRIYVGDVAVMNGYLLEVVGNNQLRLIATINDGKTHKAERVSKR
jgi:hypothetical protein